ncbi:type I-E CRISPR-associated protein Cse2/CasB [Acidithiobacillus sulfuriphilus]|uniref:Type I-E CRISPR-associated protein Cse2/CasB n=2 Tax=Acidithiobacillus sulfuriphilus TaxID=1867749 RepID=A0A3M8QSP6_9PROT|nr:type I-E CRISPR-associated protein Cse2/CasB [Acidithiobacillus sulfuriphilus]RNF59323.1 type I-E CRISPR-associated protein Cse2/CasB [Acidithiobacillus sulfuriphilus]
MNDKLENPFPRGKPDHPSYSVLRAWWQDLEHDRGERAALRRAGTLTAVMLSPAFHRLLRELRRAGCGIAEPRYPKLAAIAGLAARVKSETTDTLATRMGRPKAGGNAPTVAELRMRSLLACDDVETLFEPILRRALALLDGHANLADLATVVWHWTPMDEKRPNDPRRQMAYDYYAAPL